MRVLGLCVLAYLLLWVLVVPRDYGPSGEEIRQSRVYGQRHAELELQFHDRNVGDLVEIEAYWMMYIGSAETLAEAREMAQSEMADEREWLVDQLEMFSPGP